MLLRFFKTHILLFIGTLLSLSNLNAQISINTDNTDPDASAMLDIKSTDKGVLIPRMTSAQRGMISSPAVGLLVFDTDTESFWFAETSGWVELRSGNTKELADADGDTKIQVEESTDEDIIRFDIDGTEHFKMMTNGRLEVLNSGESVFIGEGAGMNDDLSSNKNVFVGYNAGYSNTKGNHNVFQGYEAGYANTTGHHNVFQGYRVGKNNTKGNYNIFQGHQAGYNNITGNNNIFQGFTAGENNTTGSNNIFQGSFAGEDNTTGNYNIFQGYSAGDNNTTGEYNIFQGYIAGSNNTTGNYNIFQGYQAGNNNISGSKNVFIGFKAGFYETGSNKLYIHNSSSSAPLLYGEFDTDLLRINGTLDINNAYIFPTTDGTAGQVLETDGAGALTWANKDTIQTLIEDADSNTKIQVEESANENIIRFDIDGNEHFVIRNNGFGNTMLENTANSTKGNTLLGLNAGSLVSTGLYNVLIGQGTGRDISSGSNNTFLGRNAGTLHSTGTNNVFLGYRSGRENISGTGNVFIGANAGEKETGSNKLYIENSDIAAPLLYGEFDTDLLRINGTLNINNAFSFPTADGTAGQVLETDGAGVLTWANKTVDTDTDNQTIDALNLNGTNLEISLADDGEATKTLDLSGINTVQSIIEDTDGETKIQVEESTNEDIIRFDMDGAEKYTMDQTEFLAKDAGIRIQNSTSTTASLSLEGTLAGTSSDWEIETTGSSAGPVLDLKFSSSTGEQIRFTNDGDIEFGGGNYHPAAYDRATVMISGKIGSGGATNSGVTTSGYISSSTRNSEGVYTVNFTGGTFIDEPIITVTAFATGGDNRYAVIQSISTTSFQVKIRNQNGNLSDAAFNFIAIGER